MRVHVTSHQSGAGSLGFALRALGIDEPVVAQVDDLSVGPIDSGDFDQRSRWAIDELHHEDDIGDTLRYFWEQLARYSAHEIVVWMSRRSSTEYCGMLSLLPRVDGRLVRIVDVADVEFVGSDGTPRPDVSQAFSSVSDARIVQANLYERAAPISDILRARYKAEWTRLRAENGMVRVLSPNGVISAGVDYFDETILSCVTNEWQRILLVLAKSLSKLSSGFYRQCSDDRFVVARILDLINDGVLEGQREDEEFWTPDSLIRLVQSSP